MPDYKEGIKKEVAEIKFLIHDLRVERFFNDVIHFHVTLHTDLEIYSIDQAHVLHADDLQALKAKAVSLRKDFAAYSNAVKSFSPDRTVLLAGKKYVDTIYSTCRLILNPQWGRVERVLTFLPAESRSAQSRSLYLNCIHWIRGVERRIEHFLEEEQSQKTYHEFDIAAELESYTRDVIYGYVGEKSRGRVQIELGQLDSAVIGGSLPRFRRMYFNLVMNAVDAMSNREAGVLTMSATTDRQRVVLRVRDNGVGMTPEKIRELLTDKDTLDGELHSLGFVFVRQTIEEFKGELSIESQQGKGTTITVSLPYLKSAQPGHLDLPEGYETNPLPRVSIGPRRLRAVEADERPLQSAPAMQAGSTATALAEAVPAEHAPADEQRHNSCGRMIYRDYEISEAPFPGSIFAIAITEDGTVDFFTHRPYERYWNVTHDDLSPMFFRATVRGRLEEDDQRRPVLTLSAPQSISEYFDFKEVSEKERSAEKYTWMVHDEYIRVARKLVNTGLPPQLGVLLDKLSKFFPGNDDLAKLEPIPLERLAKEPLTTEGS